MNRFANVRRAIVKVALHSAVTIFVAGAIVGIGIGFVGGAVFVVVNSDKFHCTTEKHQVSPKEEDDTQRKDDFL